MSFITSFIANQRAESLTNKGITHLERGYSPASAEKDFYLRALDLVPDHCGANFSLSNFYYRREKWELAAEHATMALASSQKKRVKKLGRKAHIIRGISLLALGQFEEAEADLQSAIDSSPKDYEAYPWLALLCAQTDRLDKAEELFEQAIELENSDPEIYYLYGTACKHNDQMERAQEMFKKALEVDQQFGEAWNELGVLSYQRGDYDEAARCFERHLLVDSKSAGSLNGLGMACMRRQEFEMAHKHFRKSLRLDPGSVSVRVNIALIHEKLGRREEAKASLEELILDVSEEDPEYWRPHYNLSIIAVAEGDNSLAAKLLKKALKLSDDAKLEASNDPDLVEIVKRSDVKELLG
jgi:tetratricopeptide (TPR) repeat protein